MGLPRIADANAARRRPLRLEPPQLRRALEDLPFALALVTPRGDLRWRNERFDRRFDPDALAIRPVLEAAGRDRDGVLIRAGTRDRGPLLVRAHVVELADLRLLAVDDSPGGDKVLSLLSERVEQLEREVMVDPLTHAWNRRYLDTMLEREIVRSRRHCQPLSAAMIDIDHFKSVNDRHGHAVGDAVLREFVELALGSLRSSDTLCRHGGEEFVALLPCTRHGAAHAVADRLRRAVSAHVFPGAGHVTVSLGVGELLAGEDERSFLARLDSQLYAAKSGGRDRVARDPRGALDVTDENAGDGVVVLAWKEAYASGHGGIDAEHRELFSLGNALIAASLRDDRDALHPAMARCLDHVKRHFAHEEAILERAGYRGLATHRESHRRLLAQADTLSLRALGPGSVTGALVDYLAHDVIVRHLLLEDREFFDIVSRFDGAL